MTINFSHKLFNPLYWHLKKYMNDTSIRYIFVYGGSSAAKTFTLTQAVITDAVKEKDNYMILRKYGSDIDDSIYGDFSGIVSNWNLGGIFECQQRKIKNNYGGVIRFRGLDDSEKIKGISRFKRVVLEEMTQFDHEDFKQIRKRLRGRAGQQIIGLWNPVSEEHWLKKEVIDMQNWTELPKFVEDVKYSELHEDSFVRINEAKNTILIKTTYHDNYWIIGHPELPNVGYRDEHVLADFEADKIFDYPYYRVYACGDWGRLDTGAEFYKGFNVTRNTSEAVYNANYPLHLSFDENVNPYQACTIWQTENNNIRQIDEITLENPNNTLENVITEIKKRYHSHGSGMFIYGDATSRKADAKLQKGYNFFTLIMNGLQEFKPQLRVPLSNPSVMMRGLFINQIFMQRFTGVSVTIGKQCKRTIEDIRYVKEAPDGTKLKEKTKDVKTGVSYEKYGHLSDTMDYFLCFYLNDLYTNFQYGDSTQKRVALKPKSVTNF